MNKPDLYGHFLPEIAALITPLGLEKYRAAQIAEWLYKRHITDFQAMRNLPQAQRNILTENLTATTVTVAAQQDSTDSKTTKYLLSFPDNQSVETVLMRQPYGNSVCVSTQVGCAMGCVFCASTLGGMARDLTGGEILAQVLYIQQHLQQVGQTVDSVVIMGAGEPLLNYEHVLRFIRLCHEPYVLGLGYRSFTLSTAGIVPGIVRLADEGLPVTLAISLHAPTDELRTQLMPINKTYSIADILAAADHYAAVTGRRVTYEYILIRDRNDRSSHARQLAALLKGKLANINLIPVNPVPERGLHRPEAQVVSAFAAILKTAGLQVTVRREMGADIQAACGQLRKQTMKNNAYLRG